MFVYDASPRVYGYSGFITAPDYGLSEITTVQNYLEFSTDTDLPAGALQVYQKDESGASLIIGQTSLPFTPAGETIQIFLQNSADIEGERRQTNFQMLSNDAIQEDYEIRLKNRGENEVEVFVPERMTRSARWEILGSSVPYEQPDPFGIEYTVTVPPGGETVITYTVLYTRPQ